MFLYYKTKCFNALKEECEVIPCTLQHKDEWKGCKRSNECDNLITFLLIAYNINVLIIMNKKEIQLYHINNWMKEWLQTYKYKCTIIRLLWHVFFLLHHLKLKTNQINGNVVFSSKVLWHTCGIVKASQEFPRRNPI